MIAWYRPAIALGACFLLGALSWFALGGDPDAEVSGASQDIAWVPPAISRGSLDISDAVWQERDPWGATPSGPAPGEELAPPSAIPVGTTRTGGEWLAVFLAPDGSTLRLRQGDALPGGGSVEKVTEFDVAWTDPLGNRQEQHLLTDPLPPQAN